MIENARILVTGGSGQVARPVAEALAARNEVWCLGRFGDAEAELSLKEHGVRTVHWDMGRDGLADVPKDFTHVLHAAVHRGDGTDFDTTVEANAVGAARLMTHCRNATAFLYVSSGVVYDRREPRHRYAETDPLAGQAPWLPTYPIAKIATEGVVRGLAVTLGLPTIIARLNVAYGPYGHGGLPVLLFRRMLADEPCAVPREGQNYCNLLHTDDVVRQVPLLWEAASVPARVVNWGGDEEVGVTDLLEYMSRISGVPVKLEPGDRSRETAIFDNTLRRTLIGDCEVPWREGVARTLRDHAPDVFATA
ncbi:MAG TPA: NAD(P)-dependent oxidoreductase [Thermomonospora sp.]|nr:NAD(P)-dependent oxidoreductase [Thermomonospora sp.]